MFSLTYKRNLYSHHFHNFVVHFPKYKRHWMKKWVYFLNYIISCILFSLLSVELALYSVCRKNTHKNEEYSSRKITCEKRSPAKRSWAHPNRCENLAHIPLIIRGQITTFFQIHCVLLQLKNVVFWTGFLMFWVCSSHDFVSKLS